MRWFWIVLGFLALALGLAGVVLPLLPTTPFMLLAAAFFARSSPRLHQWLLQHRLFGPPIRDWRDHRAISPKAKRMALLAMVTAWGLSAFFGLGTKVLALQAAVLLATGGWIWTRADGPTAAATGAGGARKRGR